MADSSLAPCATLEFVGQSGRKYLLPHDLLCGYPVGYVSLKAKMSIREIWPSIVKRHLSAYLVICVADLIAFALWALCIEYVFENWGLWVVVLGLVLGVVGIVPLAAFLALIHGEWRMVGFIVLTLSAIFGVRVISRRIFPFTSFRKLRYMKMAMDSRPSDDPAKSQYGSDMWEGVNQAYRDDPNRQVPY
jgi:hypothetical protein